MQAAMPVQELAPKRARAQGRTRVDNSVALTACGLILLNAVVAVAMRTVQPIATAHAILTLGAGVIYAATTRRIQNLTIVIAYIVGSEVLWRMCKASVFWEYGKYAAVAVALVGLIRLPGRRNLRLAAIFFGLLLPSTLLTLEALGPGDAREQVSFTLAGPLCLAVCAVFFSNIRLTQETFRSTVVAVVAPVFGIFVLAILRTRAVESLDFVNAANSTTSGGFGPNQVSAALGLATFFLIVVSIDRDLSLRVRIGALVLAGVLAIQAALTFARGGLVLALVSGLVAFVYLMRGSPRRRLSIALIALLCGGVARYVIVPRLNEMTEGKIGQRYSTTKSSGRDLFAESEIGFFFDNPVLGVGPGVGTYLRQEREESIHGASHTEYTRLLGEHGILGILALGCVLMLGARAFRSAKTPTGKALSLSLLVWAALFFAVYSTRMAAPSFAFGLAFAVANIVPKPSRPAVVRT